MAPNEQQPTKCKPSRAWLVVNIFLTSCCILFLMYGFYKATFHSSNIYHVSDYIEAVVLSTLFAMLNVLLILTSFISALSVIIIPAAFLALYINAGYAIYYHVKKRYEYPGYTTKNLIFALIPPIFWTILLVVAYSVFN